MSKFNAPIIMPHTQKARGVYALMENLDIGARWPTTLLWATGPVWLIKSREHIKHYLKKAGKGWTSTFPAFARPCPCRPRHGFVDSRIVNNEEELWEIWNETKLADPMGEMLLHLGKLAVRHNAVLVGTGGLTIGKGNDGATGGKQSTTIPTLPVNVDVMAWAKENELYNDGETIYFEFIESVKRSWVAVQARSGPAVNGNLRNYIPREVEVTQVIEPETEDLLKWEQITASLKGQDGIVVHHPGGSLGCHAAVHCILNEIPYVTYEKPPALGSVLQAEDIEAATVDRKDYRTGVYTGMRKYLPISGAWTDEWECAFVAAMNVLHNSAAMMQHPNWGRLLGYAGTIVARLGAILCHGEMRYKNGAKDNGRTDTYSQWRMSNMSELFAGLNPNEFLSGFSGSYGGPPWALCAHKTTELWQAVRDLALANEDPIPEEKWKPVLQKLNEVVNLAHNGGWWFDKIASKTTFNEAAKFPALKTTHGAVTLGYILRRNNRKLVNKCIEGPLNFLPDDTVEDIQNDGHNEDGDGEAKEKITGPASTWFHTSFWKKETEIQGTPTPWKNVYPKGIQLQVRPLSAGHIRFQAALHTRNDDSKLLLEKTFTVSSKVWEAVQKSYSNTPEAEFLPSGANTGAKYIPVEISPSDCTEVCCLHLEYLYVGHLDGTLKIPNAKQLRQLLFTWEYGAQAAKGVK